MNKKKILVLAMSLAMVAILAIGGTIAYFTDTDAAKNVFTVGSVDVKLYETYLHRDAPSYEANLTDDRKGETYPIEDDKVIETAKDYQNYLEDMREVTMMPGMSINKMPFVKNEGNSDTFIRIRVLMPAEWDLDQLMDSVICTTALESEFKRPEGCEKYVPDAVVTRGDVEYNQYTFIRNEALEPDEMTDWNVWNTIALDSSITSENDIVGKDFEVHVEVDAIQAATFADVDAAFEAFDAQNAPA